MGSFLPLPMMTDHNANKIDLEDRGDSTPDGCDLLPEATSTEGNVPAGSGTLCLNPPDDNETVAISSRMPTPNPFEDVAKAAPFEAELHDLAVRNSGVQITERHHVHVGTPAPLLLTAPAGPQGQVDWLACIGMAVRVTRTV